jgi:4-amino-4-deoxy-L-arabinose transferase-like glycosyltransferase
VTTPRQTGPPIDAVTPKASSRRWYLWLALIALAGSAIPVTWILRSEHPYGINDAWYFYYQARFIFDGMGWFISPFSRIDNKVILPGASHPPLWTLMLVVANAIGLKSYVSQLLWACAVGAAAVFMTGMAAREVAGRRAGLIAGVIAALYPNYWINYGLGLGETLLLLLIATIVFVSIRFWRHPSLPRAATLGLLCALAALTRAEQSLLVVLVLLPLVLVLQGVSPRRRLMYVGVGLAVALVTVAPWVGFNLARFSHATYLSTDSGSTIATANCPSTYHGPFLGYDNEQCIATVKFVGGDESAVDSQLRHLGLTYARAHESRLPVVLAARVGRELGLFEPLQQLHFEQFINGRPYPAALIGLIIFYATVVLGVLGAIVLRRRRITLVPFLGLLGGVVITSMVTFGETRYRVPLDVALVVLSAVGLDGVLPRQTPAPTPAPTPDLEAAGKTDESG